MVVLTLISALFFANSAVAFAEPTESIQINLSPAGISYDTGEDAGIDYESHYAYDGEDYVYSQVTFGKDQYAVNRSEFGKLMNLAYRYGTPEEYFVAYRESTELDDVSVITKEPVLPEKDTSMPWVEWTSEQWQAYEAWEKEFQPDDYQNKLLGQFSPVEIYSYYMGLGYTIDEFAFSEYFKQKEEYDSLGLTSSVSENSVNEKKSISYTRMIIQYELDSMYDREFVFCVTEDNMKDLGKELESFSQWSDEDMDVTNPNAYVPGKYFFEIGSLDEHMIDVEKVDKATGTKAYRYLKERNEDISLTDDNGLEEEYYKVKVCVLQKGKPASVEMLVKKNVAMTLLSKYLPNNNSNVKTKAIEQPADNAKG